MSKAILISIKPQFVASILNLRKTIEIRKTAPKEWTDYLFANPKAKPEPMDVYIYCTKTIKPVTKYNWGEFTFDDLPKLGKVIAKFVLREMKAFYYFDDELCHRACLDREQMADYLGDKLGYAWHISDLVIFDKPKELKDFGLKRPPQSWCRVEIKCGE